MPEKPSLDRRDFLKSAAVTGAAALDFTPARALVPAAIPPLPAQAAAPAQATAPIPPRETDPPATVELLTTDRPGGDFMVDVIKSLDFEYVAANPGSSFRGIHESIVNYGGNAAPEFITCCHEESSVAMAHGYFKAEGKPMAVLCHGTVGMQHAAMAIYNAYCDRVPVYLMAGNTLDATLRRPGVEWAHSVQDAAAMVRDFIKWDDLPISLPHFAESAVRAYKIAMTPPMMPVLLVLDGGLQEDPITSEINARLRVPKLTRASAPQGDSGAVAEAARLLVAAQNPVIVADRAARTPAGIARLIELAETLQAPVINQGGRMNFPTRHPLNQSANARQLVANADVIIGLELTDFWGTVNASRDSLVRTSRSVVKPGTKLISITALDLATKGNYQDFQRYPEVDIAMAADAEATLPALTEACKRLITADRRTAFADRAKRLAEAHGAALERARADAAYGWDATPISTARMTMELWGAIKNEDWALVAESGIMSDWTSRLWSFEKHYQSLGGSGGAGVGYGAPAAIGAALANKKRGRLSVTIQGDGDFLYAPGVWWTAAHHRIPLLAVMHNNRAYHQEMMHLQRMANRHQRGITRANIGTSIDNPNVDFAKIAQGLGVHAQGPITNPNDLGPALRRAIEVVKRGEPSLIDVVTQPR
ncbi:MAG TPA: thiamine pyrophosphate-dependent enzyme [Vicinamibacterales bacterium]|jgi:thiamine pyrophosphate-dependent acetolactate synthase large subunit-like protein|nr:thiamine pyrophosphate-dependent enzyme [Vicinamibacterales bacterium]